jgi:hypothetical protein
MYSSEVGLFLILLEQQSGHSSMGVPIFYFRARRDSAILHSFRQKFGNDVGGGSFGKLL